MRFNIAYSGDIIPTVGVYKSCVNCGKEYYAYPYNASDRKFCSTNCANKANASKQSLSKSGKNNPMYRHGLYSVKNSNGSKRKILDLIRKCEICDIQGEIGTKGLVVHHKDENQENNKLSNLLVVCRTCHHKLHNKGGGVE